MEFGYTVLGWFCPRTTPRSGDEMADSESETGRAVEYAGLAAGAFAVGPRRLLPGVAAPNVWLAGTNAWLPGKPDEFGPLSGLVLQPAHPLIAVVQATANKLAMIVGNLLKVVTHYC